MNAPTFARHLKRPRQSRPRRSIDSRHAQYEVLKAQMTAHTTTHEEYQAACQRAAQIAGV